jgi:hypothetical protein
MSDWKLLFGAKPVKDSPFWVLTHPGERTMLNR